MPHVPGERDNGDPDLVLGGLRLDQQQRHGAGVHEELAGSHGPRSTLHHNLPHLPHRLHLGWNFKDVLIFLSSAGEFHFKFMLDQQQLHFFLEDKYQMSNQNIQDT